MAQPEGNPSNLRQVPQLIRRQCGQPVILLDAYRQNSEEWRELKAAASDMATQRWVGLTSFVKNVSSNAYSAVATRFNEAPHQTPEPESDEEDTTKSSSASSLPRGLKLHTPPASTTQACKDSAGSGLEASASTAASSSTARRSEHPSSENENMSLGPLEKGAIAIERYCFLDEGVAKGTVKLYIKAEELNAETMFLIDEAHVDFKPRGLCIRAVASTGHVYVLREQLFAAVEWKKCKFSLSESGHKLTVTLKKTDPTQEWPRLKGDGARVASVSASDFF